jgi:aconitate hydratase
MGNTMNKKSNQYRQTLAVGQKRYAYFSLVDLGETTGVDMGRLPYSLRILLEGCLRRLNQDGFLDAHLDTLLNWNPRSGSVRPPVAFLPARVLLQDFTGLPVLNDLTALRSALRDDGKDPARVNPRIPVDLVIDHSVQVDAYGCADARRIKEQREFDQNVERYQFLKWSKSAYDNLRVLPPGLGICHQVNLEHLASIAFPQHSNGETLVYPDTVLGTDSHTPMINGLGVLGWGVGGIEVLAAMLGYPGEFTQPDVIGLELKGELNPAATPTDLTLTITSRLRQLGVVGKFVEVFGESYANLPVETRAMIANMSPESGATCTYFPVDNQTLAYLRRTGRSSEQIELVETYFRAQGLFREAANPAPQYSQLVTVVMDEIQPLLAGPKRPQDIIPLAEAPQAFSRALAAPVGPSGFGLNETRKNTAVQVQTPQGDFRLAHGAVLIAAITSCTNTSDAGVMIAAGLLARNAARAGLRSQPWVKTSLAPGSRAVSTYLKNADLQEGLEALGFYTVGYGCTTCIGNSGPLDEPISQAVTDGGLVCAAVLSGNRNFEGRIHPQVRASFLASPPLVVAYALAGRIDFDFEGQALGIDQNNQPVFLRDIYPSREEVETLVDQFVRPEIFVKNYENLYNENLRWNSMPVPSAQIYPWQGDSTLIQEPRFLLSDDTPTSQAIDIEGAYALVVLGDSITTDHISPAGAISPESDAGRYLRSLDVPAEDFISFGARRGHHEVMLRGTFSNPRLLNLLASGREGGITRHIPSGEILSIYDASMRYLESGTPLILLAGKAYGSGSSRDWAAKGTFLLGVRAVIAESYERIHRTNLLGVGVLPLQYIEGENAQTLGISGEERFSIRGISDISGLKPLLRVSAQSPDGKKVEFDASALIETPLDLAYFQSGGLARKILADLD